MATKVTAPHTKALVDICIIIPTLIHSLNPGSYLPAATLHELIGFGRSGLSCRLPRHLIADWTGFPAADVDSESAPDVVGLVIRA